MLDEQQLEENRRFSIQARRDLQDIMDLRKHVPFQRYFMRRLKERRDDLFKQFRYEPATLEEREILRRSLDEVENLEKLLDTDESNIKTSLDRQT